MNLWLFDASVVASKVSRLKLVSFVCLTRLHDRNGWSARKGRLQQLLSTCSEEITQGNQVMKLLRVKFCVSNNRLHYYCIISLLAYSNYKAPFWIKLSTKRSPVICPSNWMRFCYFHLLRSRKPPCPISVFRSRFHVLKFTCPTRGLWWFDIWVSIFFSLRWHH